MIDYLRFGTEQASSLERWSLKWFFRRTLGLYGLGNAIKLRALKSVWALEGGKHLTLLDLGCGDGRYSAYLKGKIDSINIIGIDACTESVERARKMSSEWYPKPTFECVTFEKFQPNCMFDAVICLDSIYYTESGLIELERILKNLRPGGELYLGLPNLNKYYGKSYRYNGNEIQTEHAAAIYSYDVVLKFLSKIDMEILSEVHFPNRFVAWIIQVQRRFPKTTLLLFPIALFLAIYAKQARQSSGTHYLIRAKKCVRV